MTKVFDDKAKAELLKKLTADTFNFKPISSRDMEVRQLEVKEVRGMISLLHYSKSMPDSTKFVYGAFIDEQLIGIACFGMGTSKKQYTSIIPDIKNGEYVELTRLWCLHNAPKNTESMFISKALKMLPPEIKLVLSYADSSKGHCGIIYQATNWHYLGTTKVSNRRLVDSTGQEYHVRLISLYKERHPELRELSTEELMSKFGWSYTECGVKYRYVYLRGTKREKKEMYKLIQDRVEKYPKCSKESFKTDTELLLEEINQQETTGGAA